MRGLAALLILVVVAGGATYSWVDVEDCGLTPVTHPETGETYSDKNEFEQAVSDYRGEEVSVEEFPYDLEVKHGVLQMEVVNCDEGEPEEGEAL